MDGTEDLERLGAAVLRRAWPVAVGRTIAVLLEDQPSPALVLDLRQVPSFRVVPAGEVVETCDAIITVPLAVLVLAGDRNLGAVRPGLVRVEGDAGAALALANAMIPER